eukprot:6496649-Pyramimonas_sp.AAC.1
MTVTSARALCRYPTAERPLKTRSLEHKEERNKTKRPRARDEAPSQPRHLGPADVCVIGHRDAEQMRKIIECRDGAERKCKWINKAQFDKPNKGTSEI